MDFDFATIFESLNTALDILQKENATVLEKATNVNEGLNVLSNRIQQMAQMQLQIQMQINSNNDGQRQRQRQHQLERENEMLLQKVGYLEFELESHYQHLNLNGMASAMARPTSMNDAKNVHEHDNLQNLPPTPRSSTNSKTSNKCLDRLLLSPVNTSTITTDADAARGSSHADDGMDAVKEKVKVKHHNIHMQPKSYKKDKYEKEKVLQEFKVESSSSLSSRIKVQQQRQQPEEEKKEQQQSQQLQQLQQPQRRQLEELERKDNTLLSTEGLIEDQRKMMRQIELDKCEKQEMERKKTKAQALKFQLAEEKERKKETKRKEVQIEKRKKEVEVVDSGSNSNTINPTRTQAMKQKKETKHKEIQMEKRKIEAEAVHVVDSGSNTATAQGTKRKKETKCKEMEKRKKETKAVYPGSNSNTTTATQGGTTPVLNEFELMRRKLSEQKRKRENSNNNNNKNNNISKQRRSTMKRKEGQLASYLYTHTTPPKRSTSDSDTSTSLIFQLLANKISVKVGRDFLRQEQELAELKTEEHQLQQEINELTRQLSGLGQDLNALKPKYEYEMGRIEKREKFAKKNLEDKKSFLENFNKDLGGWKVWLQIHNTKAHVTPNDKRNKKSIDEALETIKSSELTIKKIPLEKQRAKDVWLSETDKISGEMKPLEKLVSEKRQAKSTLSSKVVNKKIRVSYMARIDPLKEEYAASDSSSFEILVKTEIDKEIKEREKLVMESKELEPKLIAFKNRASQETEKVREQMLKLYKDRKKYKGEENIKEKIKELKLGDEPHAALEIGIDNIVSGGKERKKVLEYLQTKGWTEKSLCDIMEMGKRLKELNHLLKIDGGLQFDINSMRDHNNLSFLMAAVQNEDEETARLCLELGGNPDERNSNGQTALFFARYFNLDKFITLLIQHGAKDIGTNAYWDTILDKSVPVLHEIDWITTLRIAEKAAIPKDTQTISSDTLDTDPNWRMEMLSDAEQKVVYSSFDTNLKSPEDKVFQRTVLLEENVCKWLLEADIPEKTLFRRFLNGLKPADVRKKGGTVSCHRRAIVGSKDLFEVMCSSIEVDNNSTVNSDDTVVLFSPFVESQIDGVSNVGVLIWAVTTDSKASHIKALIEEAEFKRNKIDYPNDIFPDHRELVLRLGKDMHLVDLHTSSILDGGMMELFTLNVDDGDLKKMTSQNFNPAKRIRDHEQRTRNMLFWAAEEGEVKMNQDVLANVQLSMSTNLFGGAGTGKTYLMVEKISRIEPDNKLLVISRLPRLVSAIKTRVEESRDITNVTFITYNDLMAQLLRCTVVDDGLSRMKFSAFSQVHFCETTSTGTACRNSFERDFFHAFLDEGERKAMKKLELEAINLWSSFRTIKSHVLCSLSKRHLSREEFTGLPKSFGLNGKQRDLAFNMYLRYEEWLADKNRKWDEADRVLYILRWAGNVFSDEEFVPWQERAYRRGEEGLVDVDDMPMFPFYYHMVFIDEAQDFSDCDLALLVRMSSLRSLFVGADPAQSVEIGIKMRVGTINNVFHSCLPTSHHNALQVRALMK